MHHLSKLCILLPLIAFVSCSQEIIENGIYGTIKDAATSEPIPNATVTTEPPTQAPTSVEPGVFRIEDIEPGVYQVTVTAAGYRSQTKEVQVKTQFAQVNFTLERQELVVTPTALVFAPNRGTLALTLGRRSDRTLTWEIDPSTIEPWLAVDPLKGEVASISSSVTVKLLRDRLPSTNQEHNAEIIIRSNGGDVTVTVTVQAEANGARTKLLPQRSGTVFVGDAPFAGPEQIAADPSIGRAFVTNSKANLISVIDTFTDQVVRQIPINQAGGGLKWARGIIANPDRREVYVANFWSGTLSVIDAIEMTERDLIPVGPAPVAMETSEDGGKLYLIRSPKEGGELVVIDLQARLAIQRLPIGVELSAIARKGDFLYIADSIKNQLFVVELQTFSVHTEIPVGSKPSALAASPPLLGGVGGGSTERDFVYVANALDGTVSIVNTVSQRVEETIRVGSQPRGLAVDGGYDDGDLLYVTNSGTRSVSAIDVAKRKVIGDPITVGTTPIGIVVLSRGNKIYVVNSISDDVSILKVGN